jgi:predicted RNA binding protein YcfA (HicA-like mRNA interferase family)
MPKVREALELLRDNGWTVVRTTGSHRQLKHPVRPGTVTVPGRPRDEIPTGTWRSILKQAGLSRGSEQ